MKLKWNRQSFENVRRAPAVISEVDRQATRVAAACGGGYVTSGQQGKTRYRSIVYPDTWRAKQDNWRNNTMVKRASAWGLKMTGG